jgi:uncharacterized membrane protein
MMHYTYMSFLGRFGMILFWVIFIWLIVWLIGQNRRTDHKHEHMTNHSNGTPVTPTKTPTEILKRRLAEGKITAKQFDVLIKKV